MSLRFLSGLAAAVIGPLVLAACSAADAAPTGPAATDSAASSSGAENAVAASGAATDTSIAAPGAALLTVEAPATQSDVPDHLGGRVVFKENPNAAQLTYLRLSDGMTFGTASEAFARPALSLIKLYLAAYVLERGTLADKYEAIEMITNSSDQFAGELYARYPDSVNAIAREYGLRATRGADQWGFSVTSTHDVVSFIAQLLTKDPTHPILVAMSQAEKMSADGYAQDFGTATLPGVIGTKWGWSDDRSLHSSVSFGEDFVVAAAITGSAKELSTFVRNQASAYNVAKANEYFEKKSAGALPTPSEIRPTAKPTAKAPASTGAGGSPEPKR